MIRTVATILFSAAIVVANAQSREITVQDSEAMMAKATERMELVDKTTILTSDQKAQVTEVYMQIERQMNALEQRFAIAKASPEAKEADMKYQYENMDRYAEEKLATILTTEQHAKWLEASK